MLELAKDAPLKTQIMYRANLSFSQLNEYLDFLLITDLLRQSNNAGKEVYLITERGMDFLQRHKELTEMLKATP
jgi:predicted transcriptional regulator